MVWKSGDTVDVPIYLETLAGAPATYANYAAFIAATWSITWYQGATALSSQPTYTVVPIGSTGVHAITFILPYGVTHFQVSAPATHRSDPFIVPLITGYADIDSVDSRIAPTIGTPVANSSLITYDFTSVEGDNFTPQEFTIPSGVLKFINTSGVITSYSDLSDISAVAWTIAASARRIRNQIPANAVDFSYTAIISSKTLRKVAIGFYGTPPAAAKVQNDDGTADTAGTVLSTAYRYDIQLVPPVGSTYASAKLTVVSGTHTIRRQQTTSP